MRTYCFQTENSVVCLCLLQVHVLVSDQFSPPHVQRMRGCLMNTIYMIFHKPFYCSIECINKISCTDNHVTVARTDAPRDLVARQYM
jgi:hypothetical protein